MIQKGTNFLTSRNFELSYNEISPSLLEVSMHAMPRH